MRCYLIYCVLVIDLVWAHVDFVRLDSSALQLIQCDSFLCWFDPILFAVIWFDLNQVSSIRFDSMLTDVIWLSILLKMVKLNSMLFDSDWFHVVPFHATFVGLIVVYSSWFDSFRSDVIWFNVLRVELRSFDVIWFDLVCFDLIRRGSMCFDLIRCHFMWSELICFALAHYGSILVWFVWFDFARFNLI